MNRLLGAGLGVVSGVLVGLSLWLFVGIVLPAGILIALVCGGVGALVGSRFGVDEDGADEEFGSVEQLTERRK